VIETRARVQRQIFLARERTRQRETQSEKESERERERVRETEARRQTRTTRDHSASTSVRHAEYTAATSRRISSSPSLPAT